MGSWPSNNAPRRVDWDELNAEEYEARIGGSYADIVVATRTPNVPCNCDHDDHWKGYAHLYGQPRPPVAFEIGSRNALCLFCAQVHQ